MDDKTSDHIGRNLHIALAADLDLAIEYLRYALESKDEVQIELAVRDVEEARSIRGGLSH